MGGLTGQSPAAAALCNCPGLSTPGNRPRVGPHANSLDSLHTPPPSRDGSASTRKGNSGTGNLSASADGQRACGLQGTLQERAFFIAHDVALRTPDPLPQTTSQHSRPPDRENRDHPLNISKCEN